MPRLYIYSFALLILLVSHFRACADPIIAVDTQNRLVIFDSASPNSITIKPITGLNGMFSGVDFRPSNGQLYVFTVNDNQPANIYRINPGTGVATFVTKTSEPVSGFNHAIDFDPVTDKLRVVGAGYINAPNLLIDVDSGQVTTESPLFYPPAYYPQQEEGVTNISALAYTNNVKNATVSKLYGIDIAHDSVVMVNPSGQPSGSVFLNGSLGVDATAFAGFDIQEGSGEAYAVLNPNPSGYSQLYRIDLQVHSQNRAQLVGQIGNTNLLIEDFAIRRAQPRTFQVNSASDAGDGLCDVAECTLREAIDAANAAPTDDTITFNIPNTDPNRNATTGVFTITPQSALPPITDTIVIDGYSQPGASPNTVNQGNNAVLLIEINGANAGENSNGLVLLAMHSIIRGLVINRFGDTGIRMESDPSAHNLIEGNFIGTDAGGTRALGNKNGILIDANPRNLIGGTRPQARNLISGNRENGIVTGNFTFGLGTFENRIEGNYIGTNRHGLAALGNRNGVALIDSTDLTALGGAQPGAGNLISGNRIGVLLQEGRTVANKVQGNIIGADRSGLLPVPNTYCGVEADMQSYYSRDSGNLIGGTEPGEGNIIAFNGSVGVLVSTGESVRIRGNSFYNNGVLAINFNAFNEGTAVPTPNDEADMDSDGGPNGLQNHPTITSANYQDGRLVVSGRLKSTPSTKFALDFFEAGAPNKAGHYEAKRYLNSILLTTDSDGLALFSVDLGESGSQHITATATNEQEDTFEFGSTSEISPAFSIPPGFRFAVNELRIKENIGQAQIIVERSTTTGAATVDFEFTSGTAQDDVDFIAYPNGRSTVSFADGEKSATIPLSIINDTLDEPLESINMRLTNPSSGYGFYTPAATRLFIEDDDASPAVSINGISVTEGNGGSANATFTVTLSKVSAQTIQVSATTYNGSARAPQDYGTTSVRLIFLPGERTKTFSVPVQGDTLNEPTELFYVVLSAPVNAVIGNGRGRGVIVDNDEMPRVSIEDTAIEEGTTQGTSGAQRLAIFKLRLSAPSGRVVKVLYVTENNSALRDRDYIATAGVVAFNAGSTTAYVRVPIVGDTLDEANENFFMIVSPQSGALQQVSRAVGTIIDDDRLPSLSIADAAISEGDLGSRDLTFTVTLSRASGQNILVNYATANGTARSTSDYTASNGTLAFAPGETTKTFSVSIRGDAIVEADETLYALLTGAINTTISKARGKGTVINDDSTE
ncbi:MAG TPA: Calx-beta domain-containing protein [Abditibacteriaceae bacterium]